MPPREHELHPWFRNCSCWGILRQEVYVSLTEPSHADPGRCCKCCCPMCAVYISEGCGNPVACVAALVCGCLYTMTVWDPTSNGRAGRGGGAHEMKP